LNVSGYALAVVLEVGFGSPGEFEVLVSLLLGFGDESIEVFLNLSFRGWRG
jgi:hypothetical protein